jgi:uncharacterized repeat protein (TIGR01451 family)
MTVYLRRRLISLRATLVLGLFVAMALAGSAAFAQVDVSTGGPATTYPTLKDAFDAINAGTHTGAITIAITADTAETATAVLNASGAGSASYTSIVVNPTGGAMRTISGAIAAGSPLIDLNGADNVTFDGLNTGGNGLTISNTTVSATSGTSTIRFIGDATANTITNASILGSSTMATTTNGGTVYFAAGAVTTGNDDNIISNNNIGPAGANLPTKAIHGNGSSTSTTTYNSGIQITGNNIFDYFNATAQSNGIYMGAANTGWTISNNRFYQTATRTQTGAGTIHSVIQAASGTGNDGHSITGNTIGFANSAGTGTYSLVGSGTGSKMIAIYFSASGVITPSSVQGNTISGINLSGVVGGTSTTGAFLGVSVASNSVVNIGNISGNTIGSAVTPGSISITSNNASSMETYGIYYFPNASGNISNNTIGGITATNTGAGNLLFFGIRAFTNNTFTNTLTANTIGTAAAPITVTSSATGSRLLGIFSQSGAALLTGNTISNLTLNSPNIGTGLAASLIGISIDNTGNSIGNNVSQNVIRSLGNTAAAAATWVTGLHYNGSTTGTHTVQRNFVHSLVTLSSSATSTVNGINVQAGTTTYRNNMIALGSDIGATSPTINGINETGAGTDNLYHNSVYIGGAGVTSGSGNSFAFQSSITTNVRNYRDNIFFNARSNGGATGKHYAIRVGGTTPNPAGLTSDNNILLANGTGGFTGLFNAVDQTTIADWRTATGQDFGSFQLNPQFNDPTNAVPDLHIHPTNPTPIEGNGVDVGTADDFDGQTRASLTPTDIGADAGNFSFVDLSGPSISYSPLSNTASTGNRVLTATLVDVTGVATGGLAPRIYYRKNAGSYFSQSCSLGSGNTNNGTWNCTIVAADVGGVVIGDQISYFVIAQDTLGTVSSNAAGAVATDVNNVITPPATPNSYLISTPYSGSYNVGGSEPVTSLTNSLGIFELLNAGTLTGNVIINLTSDLTGELGTVALNALSEEPAGSNFTVTIQSSSAVLRTISGAVANGLIRLNGADRVTFDGRVGGSGQFLLFRNTNSSNPTFSFLNDATGNTIHSCIVEGGNTSTTSGTILFGTSTGTLGNSNNTIQESIVRDRSDAAGVPANAIYSSGTVGAPNAGNTLTGNSIFNWTNDGLLVSASGAGNSWNVGQNSFYQTAARTTPMTALAILGGSGHTVIGNFVGGTAPAAGGSHLASTQTFRGIHLNVGTLSPTGVQGNVIRNIRSTLTGSFTASYGIFLEAGMANLGTVTGNTIGSANAAERYEISGDSYGIRVTSTSTVTVRNNTVDNFGTAPGAPTGQFYWGMSIEGAGLVATVENNTIRNITNGSVPDASFNTQTIGIQISGTGVQTVRGNLISNVGSTSVAAPTTLNNRIWGLIAIGTAVGSVVEGNRLDNLYGSSAGVGARADVITGIQSQSVANATFANNVVSLNGGADSDRSILGILDISAAPAISNYFFNSVNIHGTATGTNNSFAFNRNNTATVSILDNIFVNRRVTAGGLSVAMANSNAAAAGWPPTASNFNRLHNLTNAHLTQWLTGVFLDLPGFQAASGGDASSSAGDPLFVSDIDLHLQPTSPVRNAGVAVPGVTVDFDGDPRPAATPDIGADEIVEADLSITKTDGVTVVSPGGTVTYTIVASNAGAHDVIGATVTDTFPAQLTSCSTTCSGTVGTSCTAGPFGGNINDSVNLPAGGSVTYTAVCTVSLTPGSISNTASVAAPGGVTDPTPGNNSDLDDDTVIQAQADVTITKTNFVDDVTAGDPVTYTIVVSNAGPVAATSVTVADTFAAELLSCSTTCIGFGGGSCTSGPTAGNISTVVSLPVGAAVAFTSTCTLSPTAAGTLVNSATATVGGGVVDPDTSDNSATDTDNVINPDIFADGFESGDTAAWSSTVPLTFALRGRETGEVTFGHDFGAYTASRLAETPVAVLVDDDGFAVARIDVRRTEAGAALELRLLAAGAAAGPWVAVGTDGHSEVRIAWSSAASDGDGFVSLTVGGVLIHWSDGFQPAE